MDNFFASLGTSIKVRVIHGIFLVFFDRRTSVRANPSAETGDLQKLIECFWRFTAAIHTVWFLCSVRIDEVGFFGVLFHNRCNQWCLFVQDKVREGRALQPDGVFFVTTHCNQFGLTKYESSTGKRLFICSFVRLFVCLFVCSFVRSCVCSFVCSFSFNWLVTLPSDHKWSLGVAVSAVR